MLEFVPAPNKNRHLFGGGSIGIFLLRSVLADGLGGEADAEFLEDFAVDFASHHGGVHLAAVKEGQAVEGAAVIM